MATPARSLANKRNAQLSTGPKTTAGLAVSRMNAVSHGLRATASVVPGEDPELWEAYRAALMADLAPVGFVERELVERLAVLGWRLRRVSAYEAGVVTRNAERACRRIRGEREEGDGADPDSLDDRTTVTSVRRAIAAAEQAVAGHARLSRLYAELADAADDARFAGADALDLLADLPNHLPVEPERGTGDDPEDDGPPPLDPMRDVRHTRFLLELEVPRDQHDEPERWDGWTAGAIRVGVARIARSCKWPAKWSAAKLLAKAARDTAAALKTAKAELAGLRRQLIDVEQRTEWEEGEARRRALVSPAAAEVAIKYEGHLHRQWTATLHELERRQAARSANPPQPPVAIDLTVNAPEGVTMPSLS